MTTTTHIMIFTRYPRPGAAKTRLIPALGAAGAARLQRRMTERVVSESMALAARRGAAVSVHYTGGSRDEMSRWLGKGTPLRPQAPGDLGRRMRKSFDWLFGRGVRRGLLVGSDIPGLDSAVMERALDDLGHKDLVLGPAGDGGYYLAGFHRRVPPDRRAGLFTSIPWGTSKVLAHTLAAASREGLSWGLLPMLDDVDRPADLVHVEGGLVAGER